MYWQDQVGSALTADWRLPGERWYKCRFAGKEVNYRDHVEALMGPAERSIFSAPSQGVPAA